MPNVLVLLAALSAVGQANAQQPSLRDLNDALMRERQQRASAEEQARERIAMMRERLRALLPQYVSQAVTTLEGEGASFGDTREAMSALAQDRSADRTVIGRVGRVVVLSASPGHRTETLVSLAAAPWFAITFEGIFPNFPEAWIQSQPCAYRIQVKDQFSGPPETAAMRVDCAAFDGGTAQAAFDDMLRTKVREVLERVSRLRTRR
jgi:hypothetical protein